LIALRTSAADRAQRRARRFGFVCVEVRLM
jgi:hypothetical protein